MAHDHGEHNPIQVASKVSEFEVLELAIRELSIEHGLFSAEDHRRFKEWSERIGPAAGCIGPVTWPESMTAATSGSPAG